MESQSLAKGIPCFSYLEGEDPQSQDHGQLAFAVGCCDFSFFKKYFNQLFVLLKHGFGGKVDSSRKRQSPYSKKSLTQQ